MHFLSVWSTWEISHTNRHTKKSTLILTGAFKIAANNQKGVRTLAGYRSQTEKGKYREKP